MLIAHDQFMSNLVHSSLAVLLEYISTSSNYLQGTLNALDYSQVMNLQHRVKLINLLCSREMRSML